jgi:transposase InsO family protein
LTVEQLCAVFGVSRSWYYAALAKPEVGEADMALREAIERVVLEFPGYGYRSVTHHLKREGWPVNHKRVLRIMREESLLCQLKRRFIPTTNSKHGLTTYPNLLVATTLSAPNQVFVADITYVRLPTRFVYLATLLDAYSRYCVGWHLSATIDTQLTLRALDMA